VVWRESRVLLIRRRKPPYEGQWSIPGGRVRPGETLAGAALRELKEETGVRARLSGMIDVFESITQYGHYVMIDYAAAWVSGEPRAGDDALEARFFTLEDALERLSWDETRRAVEASLALAGRHDGALKPD